MTEKTSSVQLRDVDTEATIARGNGYLDIALKSDFGVTVTATLTVHDARLLAEGILDQCEAEDEAPKKKKKKASKRSKSDPFAEGADAALCGSSDTANPHEPATDDHLSWNDGYHSIVEKEDEDDEPKGLTQ